MTNPSYQRSVLSSCRSSTTAVATCHLRPGVEFRSDRSAAATVTRHRIDSKRTRRGYDRAVHEPPITVTCDCGQVGYVEYGERWTCPGCARTWDTSQIPHEDYASLVRSVRRYRLLSLGPPLVLAAVLVPLAIVYGVQFGLLLFVLVFAYAVFVIPKVRERATRDVRESSRSWSLGPE